MGSACEYQAKSNCQEEKDMIATTNLSEQLANLTANAISLLQRGARNQNQVQPLFNALTRYTGEKDVYIIDTSTKSVYPGRFGNRCAGCGGWIDEGGYCMGGTDHDTEEPGACGKKIAETKELPHRTQLAILISLSAKAIERASSIADKADEQKLINLIKVLQQFKEALRLS